jgi:hypothetical protein
MGRQGPPVKVDIKVEKIKVQPSLPAIAEALALKVHTAEKQQGQVLLRIEIFASSGATTALTEICSNPISAMCSNIAQKSVYGGCMSPRTI